MNISSGHWFPVPWQKADQRLRHLLANFRIREVEINSDIGIHKDLNVEAKTVTCEVKKLCDPES